MKLTRTTGLIILLGVLVIACASLYVVHSRQASQGEELQDSRDQATAQYTQLVSQNTTLTRQLAQGYNDLTAAQLALNKAKAKFPPSAETTINYDEILFQMADYCQLEIMSLTASAPSQQNVGGINYMVTTFNVVVTPVAPLPATADESVARILQFVHTIATGDNLVNASTFVNTTTIESVQMSNTQASLTIVIYSYPG